MRQDKNKTYLITCFLTGVETGKAVLADFNDADGDKIGEAWLPKSRVKQVVNGCGGFAICGDAEEEITIELPQWLAESDRIEPLIREQLLAMEGEEPGTDGIPSSLGDDGLSDDEFYGGDDDPGWGE